MLSSNELDPVGLEGTPAAELEVPSTGQTEALLDLWKSKKKGDALPYRSDFSPLEMKDYLTNIYIIEVLDNGADFLVRLAGTGLTGKFGDDFTGAKYSDDRLKDASWRLDIFRSAYERKEPVIFRFLLGPADAPSLMTENLILPVLDKQDDRIILLCVSIEVGALDSFGRLVKSA
jgi:hypothetical protein